MKTDFLSLLETIDQHNQQLYLACKNEDWARASALVETRAQLLKELSSHITALPPHHINLVGQLYQSMLITDAQHLTSAQVQLVETRDILRAIKNAQKALPLYNANKYNR